MPLTDREFGRLMLILSTFQDGSGWERVHGKTIVGYRQFERALAEVLGGRADESKALFDVIATREVAGAVSNVGYSCKVKRALERAQNLGEVYIEVSNAVAQFGKHLATLGLHTPADYRADPRATGRGVLQWIRHLHETDASNRSIDLAPSIYFVLLYDAAAENFQLFEFPANVLLDDPGLSWSASRNHISAYRDGRTVIDYYWNAGQLKFYVPVGMSTWKSAVFQLETLSTGAISLLDRAEGMFPLLWAAT